MHVATSGRSVLRAPRLVLSARLATVRNYLALTRPRVVLVAVLTGGPVLLLHRRDRPHSLTQPVILLGIVLVGAACSAINAWVERDRDALMSRTRDRPLPAGRIRPTAALAFGLSLAAAGLAVLGLWGGGLAALTGGLTLAWYIGVYTIWAKPRTARSTVLGAVAGAAAPLIASAAMDGRISSFGWALFALVFAWQPPHVWAIALFRGTEYQAAGIPMMPAVVGERGTRARMLAWALVLVPVSAVPWLLHVLGPAYAVTALAAGVWFVATIVRALHTPSAHADRRVFAVSLIYLGVLFLEMLAELALG